MTASVSTVGTLTMQLRKACGCDGASSGPRRVIVPMMAEDGVTVLFSMLDVDRACDVCDKPWRWVSDRSHVSGVSDR
jgi:hypothetical protein